MRVVITGAAGFIGSHLAERLVAQGCRVTGLDAFTPYYHPADKEANLDGLRDEPGFDLVRGDVVTTELGRLFADRPAVVHLAAQPGVRSSFGTASTGTSTTTSLPRSGSLRQRWRQAADGFVYASSSSVYGDAARYPCTEDTPTEPRSPYGVSKRTCEHLADVYRRMGLETVGMRFFTVYGPRQRPDMAIRRLCVAAIDGIPFRLHGDGSQSRDLTCVDDVVDALARTVVAPDPGNVINVGRGHEATMREIIDMVGLAAESAVPVDVVQAQQGDVRRTGADTSLARERLGWRPETGLAAGLAAEMDWVLTRHAAINFPTGRPTLVGSVAT